MNQEELWENALRLMPRGTQTMSKCPDQFVDGVFNKAGLKILHIKAARGYVPEDIAREVSQALQNVL